jgi:hypothetical protein
VFVRLGQVNRVKFVVDLLYTTRQCVVVEGDKVTITEDAAEYLLSLPVDNDGYFDGKKIWIGGVGYPVRGRRRR